MWRFGWINRVNWNFVCNLACRSWHSCFLGPIPRALLHLDFAECALDTCFDYYCTRIFEFNIAKAGEKRFSLYAEHSHKCVSVFRHQVEFVIAENRFRYLQSKSYILSIRINHCRIVHACPLINIISRTS